MRKVTIEFDIKYPLTDKSLIERLAAEMDTVLNHICNRYNYYADNVQITVGSDCET